jgi:uncharacterized delta-60 repeat protein
MSKLSLRSKSRFARLRVESLEERTNPGAGALDPTFGGDGTVTTATGPFNEDANDMLVQPDGKVVVVGSTYLTLRSEITLVRYNRDGTLDNTFGGDGLVFTSILAQGNTADSAVLQPDGMIVVAGGSSLGGVEVFAIARYKPDGSLDPTFGTNGTVTTDIANTTEAAYAVALQADGKIVAAGYLLGGGVGTAVVRYNTDGSLDNTFDGDGKFFYFAPNTNVPSDVVVQPDGKIVIVGYEYASGGSNAEVALQRLNPDGSFDTSFDGDGKVRLAISAAEDLIERIALQADGKIVVAGYTENGATRDILLARLSVNGSLDTSFDGDGIVTTAIGSSSEEAYDLAIQSDGKLVVAGRTVTGSRSDIALVRYNSDGSLDATFSGDGIQTTAIDGHIGARAVALQADGKIVVAGNANVSGQTDFALVRYNIDGSLDPLKDGLGVVTGVQAGYASSMALQTDGKIVVAGSSLAVSDDDFTVARFTADGSLDTSFDGDGIARTDFGNTDSAAAVAIQSDGKIVLVGQTFSSDGTAYNFAVARFNTDGSLDTSFGVGGRVITDFNSESNYAYSVAIDGNGKIVVAGGTFSGVALARYNNDGSLDSSFDNDGQLITPIGGSAKASSLVIDGNGKLVVGGYSTNTITGYFEFALARYNANGSLDTSFDQDGSLTTPFDSAGAGINSVKIDGNNRIVAAGYRARDNNFDFADFAVVRYNADGSLDSSFGSGGTVTTDFGGSKRDVVNSVAIDENGKLVVAGYTNVNNISDFAWARYNTDGSLDTSFDFDGKLIMNLGSAEVATSMAIQADGKIVTAGSSTTGFTLIRLRGDNHAPVTSPVSFNAVEDSVLRVNTPTFFSDPDGDLLTVTLMSSPTHGTLELAPYGSFVYTPHPEYVGPDSFMYKVTDTDGAFDTGSVLLNVVNDAADRLEVVTSSGITTFTESVPLPSTPVVIDAGVRVGSAFEDTITSATVKITSGYVPKKDVLTFATMGVIKGKFNATTATLTLTGAARPADYQAALRSVKYTNSSATPIDGIRTIAFTVKDTAGTGDAATRLLRVVGVNTKPIVTLTGLALTYKTRGRGLAVASTLVIKDVDNTRVMGATVSISAGFDALDVLSVTTKVGITVNYNAGVLTLTGNATLAMYQAVLRTLKFTTPVGAAAGLRTLSITVTDGLLASDPVTRNVTVV